MNPLKVFGIVACLLAVTTFAASTQQQQQQNQMSNSVSNSLNPSEWLTASQLQAIPSLDQVTFQQLENMPVQEGAQLMQQWYHLSQINNNLKPTFVPSPSNVPAHIIRRNGQRVSGNLNTLVSKVQEEQNFGNDEVTIFITGLPGQTQTVTKATRRLVQAYMQRYNVEEQRQQQRQQQRQRQQQNQQQNQQQQQGQQQGQQEYNDYDYNQARTSSEEDYNESANNANNNANKNANSNANNGNLIVIDLGSTLTNMKRYAMLDTEQTGAMIGKVLVQMTNQVDIPQEIIHIVAQGIASHVAGAAGRQYTRLTGHKLRRITALDPSNMLANNPNTLTSLARGDAEFVDAIHTSALGMGTTRRVGNVDFFPNGPSATQPGANNIVAASLRAVLYYAESVRPGNERNFPAVPANSLRQYQNNNGYGPRTHMGVDTDYDLEGDYILEVNERSPYGQSTPAQKQNTYHGQHQTSNNNNNRMNNRDYE